MNRRNFLKSLAVVVAASAFMPKLPAVEAGPTVAKSRGVTDAQLQEIIEATLRDLPEGIFDIDLKSLTNYKFCDIYKEH